MHKPSSKIDIAKDKLTKPFKKHFSDRVLELPPEIEHPKSFEYLKDVPINVNEEPPNIDEIRETTKTFKNNKSFGTDNLPPEGLNPTWTRLLESLPGLGGGHIDPPLSRPIIVLWF